MDKYLNKITAGDCKELLKDLPDESIDLVVTSPPYDNLRDYKGYTFDFEPIALRLSQVIKPGGVIVWVVGDATINGSETGTSFRQALGFMELGLRLHDTMIYKKDVPPINDNRYQACFEYMFIFVKGKPKTFNPILVKKVYGKRKRIKAYHRDASGEHQIGRQSGVSDTKVKDNIWHFIVGGGKTTKDKYAFKHPAMFPENLPRDHITSWSNPSDIVLDPFVGSGTTCKMAKESGRQYIGFDISEEYCELARKRIAGANVPLFV